MGSGKALLLAIGAIALSGMAASAHAGPPSGPAPSGPAIDGAVRQALLDQGGVSAGNIDIGGHNGIVLLSGTVQTRLVQRRAARLAETVRGVRGVVDLVRVAPTSRPASDVEADVRAALAADPATAGQPIQVADLAGTVTLSGTVSSAAEKRLAALAANGVAGVQNVDNALIPVARAPRPAGAIKAEVEESLSWDPWLSGLPIAVEVHGDRVVLSGAVGDPDEKERADRLAQAAGVADVVDRLRVEPGRLDGRSNPGSLGNGDIAAAIAAAFQADPRLRSSLGRVHATVAGAGEAFLYGTAADAAATHAAREDARNSVGVTRVVDGVTLAPSARPPDPALRDAVQRALLHDPDIALDDIDVTVRNGRVLLRGVVPRRNARERAAAIAAQVAGVTDVVNRLTVLRASPSMAAAPEAPDRGAQ